MREIKFRAWDKETKKMSLYPQLGFNNSVDINEQIRCCGKELMQYTGLKDKNGKEIYEGDIVRGNGLINAVIVYEESATSFLADAGFAKLKFANNSLIEVIGNRFENSELL